MLEATHLSVFYGRHQALEDVSIRVGRGEICVILGANGAGKSTLLHAIAGMTRAQPGASVSIDGKEINGAKPSRIVEHGISLVPERDAVFSELTVAENLQLGAFPARARRSETKNLTRVYELFPVLAERRRQIARTMSGGEQKMLAIGRALMSDPDILMLDEPSLGLSPLLSAELFKALKEVGKSGVGVLLVEQNANLSLKIADRGYLLENGRIVGEDTAMALVSDPAVRRAYLGDAGVEPQVARIVEPPPVVALAGKSAGEISKLAGGLAARAGAMHAAHVAAQRNGAAPNAERQTHHPTPATPIATSGDAHELSRIAAALAQRAGEMHAAHIKSLRESQPRPTPAPPTAASVPGANGAAPGSRHAGPTSEAAALTQMAVTYAKRAEASHRQLNGGRPPRPAGDIARSSNGAQPPDQAASPTASSRELAARAAALHAHNVAERRRTHTASLEATTAGHAGNQDIAPVRSKKHKNGKKKPKKSRQRGGKSKGD